MFGGLREMSGREGLEGWPGKKIALKEPDILLGEPGILRYGFDPFGDQVDAEFKASEANSSNDGLAGTRAFDAAREAHVEFDLIGLEVGEEAEIGMRRAKVIDRQPDAESPVFLQQASEVSSVFGDEGLRHFKNKAIEGQVRLAGGFDSSEDRLRIGLETPGHEVQMKGSVDAEASREGDGRSACCLVELVHVEG